MSPTACEAVTRALADLETEEIHDATLLSRLPERAAEHARACSSCRELLDAVELARRDGGLHDEPASDYWETFTERLHARLESAPPASGAPVAFAPASRRRHVQALRLAAGLLLAAGLAWGIHALLPGGSGRDPRGSSPRMAALTGGQETAPLAAGLELPPSLAGSEAAIEALQALAGPDAGAWGPELDALEAADSAEVLDSTRPEGLAAAVLAQEGPPAWPGAEPAADLDALRDDLIAGLSAAQARELVDRLRREMS